MKSVCILITAGLWLVCTGAFAQKKAEVERGVSSESVPQKALEWLETAIPEANERWYLEITSGKSSYEAKFKHVNRHYSIEFDTTGVVEDIEIFKHWDELPSGLREGLLEYFESAYERHKVRKIQEQLTGSDVVLKNWFSNSEVQGVEYLYEIEYFAKGDAGKILWEGLFNPQGELISKRQIILRPTDNLNY